MDIHLNIPYNLINHINLLYNIKYNPCIASYQILFYKIILYMILYISSFHYNINHMN